ncbi:MAG: DUF3750 domain-containing protein [Myxococcales bacterium]|nr:DUF3750 domain-containing protein [Myxococcales bacterium]MCB9606784.1 DUF3750 domain-containing protein [Polyangiaceae bacterium]
MRWLLPLLALGACVLGSGCVVAQQPVEVPQDTDAHVMLLSGALPKPVSAVARHPWLAFRERDGEWERYEVASSSPRPPLGTVRYHRMHPLTDFAAGGGDVRVHGSWHGNKATEAIQCLRREVPRYPDKNIYRAWPGPNSNTFIDYMLRECDLPADLPSTAIGKDYRGLVFGASLSSGGTGIQLETAIVGAKVGLTEGVEVHLFQMAWGIDFWPPALIVPIGPGRFGFDDR